MIPFSVGAIAAAVRKGEPDPGPAYPAYFDPTGNSGSMLLSEDNRRATVTNTSRHYRVHVLPAKTAGRWFIEYEIVTASRPTIGFTHGPVSTQSGTSLNFVAATGMAVYYPSDGVSARLYRPGGYSTIGNLPALSAGTRLTFGYDIGTKTITLLHDGTQVLQQADLWSLPNDPVQPVLALIGPSDDLRIADEPLYPIEDYENWDGDDVPPMSSSGFS